MRSPAPIRGCRDERIAQIARLQRGRVARHQLLAVGIGNSTIGRLLARGQLHWEAPGVYAVGYPGRGPLTRETSSLLACRPGTLLSHRTAAELWRLVPNGTASAPVEVTIAGRNTGHPPGVTVHRSRRLHPSEVRIRERLPVTSPARTLLDIADQVPERAIERALDEGLTLKLVRVNNIKDVIARNPGRHGATILTTLLDARTGSTISQSEAEERMLALLRAANLPQPEMNVHLLGFTVDFLWRKQRLVLEVDGYAYHSSKTAFERDRRKDAALRAAGWDVIRVTLHQIVHDSHAMIALIATSIATATPRFAA